VSALWPERAIGLVSGGGYSIQNIPDAAKRQGPEDKLRLWYQYYFHTEDGQKRIAENRRDLCRLLWRLWSPNWKFNERTYMRSASSFENPDFVQVVIHSYRHRFSLVSGDPAFEKTERCLAEQPKISVPTIVIEGDADGVAPLGGYKDHHHYFTGKYERRVLPGVGHNSPQEAPRDFAEAVLSVI
jgi:pimeloyl-ACP methyl ester carboxylesterase